MFWVVSCALHAAGQTAATTGSAGAGADAAGDTTPVLTLSSPVVRSTMDKMNLAWLFPEQLPDFRLKVDRPEWDALSLTNMESQIRGVEIRLPVDGLWVGYELPTEDDLPRATFSIQRGF